MKRRGTLADVVRYLYRNPARPGDVLFWHCRARVAGDPKRTKTFWYLTPDPECPTPYAWRRGTIGHPGPEARSALFNLRGLRLAKKRGWPIVLWTEGEKDALACRVFKLPAVSHHGGANKATEEQAAQFKGYQGLVGVVADRDDPGYACAARRARLLGEVGVRTDVVRPADDVVPPGRCPPGQICYCEPGCPPSYELWRGADLSDHVAAGYGPADLEVVPEAELRAAAERWAARQHQGAVYGAL